MHLHTHLIGIEDDRHIRGDDSINTLSLCPIYNIVHLLQLGVVYNRIDGKVGFNPVFVGYAVYLCHIVGCKVCCRCGAHIELTYTEIDRVCTRSNRRTQALIRAYRCHYLYICSLHSTTFCVLQDSLHNYAYTPSATVALRVCQG